MQTRSKTPKLASKKMIDKSTKDEESQQQIYGKRCASKHNERLWSEQRLSLSFIPDKLIGRKEEAQQIYEFIQKCLMNKINCKVLYISGVPGSGKTASTLQILNQLRKQVRGVEFFYVNSLTLKKPVDIYRLIYSHLWKDCKNQKEKGTKSHDVEQLILKLKKHHIIVVDEVDFLLTKDETIFYNLFQWSSQATTKLGFIIISNTFDFPERLSPKINSRMGDHKMYFKPYSQEEIKDVVADRLVNCPYFSSGAIIYASKKLAKYSSDIRIILNILHEAIIEHKSQQRDGQIQVKHIAKLWDQKVEKSDEALSSLPPLHLKILEYVKNQGGQCISKKLYEVLRQQGVTQGNMLILLKQLEEMGLIRLRETFYENFRSHAIKLIARY